MTYAIENITDLNITDIGGLMQATNTYSAELYGVGMFFILYIATFLMAFNFSKHNTKDSLIVSSFVGLIINYFLYKIGVLSLYWGILPGILLAVALLIGN